MSSLASDNVIQATPLTAVEAAGKLYFVVTAITTHSLFGILHTNDLELQCRLLDRYFMCCGSASLAFSDVVAHCAMDPVRMCCSKAWTLDFEL